MSEILFTAPLAYETGNPITPPSEKGSRFRVDLVDGRIYQWDSGPDVWRLFAQGLDPLPNTSAPVYIPGIGQSAFAITTDRKLYFYSGGAWNLIPVQGATGPAGPNGAAGPTGPTGPQGAAGVAGQGVPTGGTAGQVLSKIDATDFNTSWAAPAVQEAFFTFGFGATTGFTNIIQPPTPTYTGVIGQSWLDLSGLDPTILDAGIYEYFIGSSWQATAGSPSISQNVTWTGVNTAGNISQDFILTYSSCVSAVFVAVGGEKLSNIFTVISVGTVEFLPGAYVSIKKLQ